MKNERVLAIDGLRGIACLVVCASHLRLAFSHTTFIIDKIISFTPFRLIVDGAWAVILFYLLSGFSISLAVINKPNIEQVEKICRNRLFRLGWPMLLAWTIGLIMDKMNLFYHRQAGELLNNDWLIGFINYKVGFKEAVSKLLYGIWFAAEPPCVPVLWTITYLFLGTFASVIFIMILRGRKPISFILTFSIMFEFMKMYNRTFSFFLIGVGLAWLYDYSKGLDFFQIWGVGKKITTMLVLIIATFGIYGMAEKYSGKFERHSMGWSVFADVNYYFAASAVCLILFSVLISQISNVFSTKIMVLLGKVAYSVWLIHSFVIASFSSFLYVLLRTYGINHFYCTPPTFIFSIILIVLFAKVFSYWGEEKSGAWIRRMF